LSKITCKKHILVGGLERFLFFHILGIIIPTDELIFFRGVGIPPTSIEYHRTILVPPAVAGLIDPHSMVREAQGSGHMGML